MKRVLIASVVVLLALTLVPAQASAFIFFDDFNRRVNDPVGNGWTATADAVITNHSSHVTPAPSGRPVAKMQADGVDTSTLERTIDTTGYFGDIAVSYYRHTHNISTSQPDFFDFSWKLTSDVNWTSMEKVFNQPWTFQEWILPAEARNSSIDVKFTVYNEAGTRARTYLDDFKVNAIPEPASMVLFGSGLLGFLGLKRRKDS